MEGKKMPDRIDERKRIYLYYTCLSQSLQSSCSIENPFLPNSNGRNHGWLEIERELRDRKWAFSVHVIYPSVTVFSSALIFFLYHLQTQKSCFFRRQSFDTDEKYWLNKSKRRKQCAFDTNEQLWIDFFIFYSDRSLSRKSTPALGIVLKNLSIESAYRCAVKCFEVDLRHGNVENSSVHR